MTLVFLALLGAAWVVVFLPAALRAHHQAPLSSAERFRRRLELMAPRHAGGGRWVVMPEHPDRLAYSAFRRAQRRRTRILQFLLACVVASLGGALYAGGPLWEVQIAFDASLALYVVLLLEAKRRRREHNDKVRHLRTPPAPVMQTARRAVGDEGPLLVDMADPDDVADAPEFFEPAGRSHRA